MIICNMLCVISIKFPVHDEFSQNKIMANLVKKTCQKLVFFLPGKKSDQIYSIAIYKEQYFSTKETPNRNNGHTRNCPL